MPEKAPELYKQLQQSAFIVFKGIRFKGFFQFFSGDLNYRKLVADREWPWQTPFSVNIILWVSFFHSSGSPLRIRARPTACPAHTESRNCGRAKRRSGQQSGQRHGRSWLDDLVGLRGRPIVHAGGSEQRVKRRRDWQQIQQKMWNIRFFSKPVICLPYYLFINKTFNLCIW